ncbi:MAG TPA: HAD hydrolase-like protein [Parafilimonas sp.]|nr:HAD hydrolase-like protein [Parafilimonas sp.]
MQHSIELAVFDISGTTVKDKGEITEAFEKTFQQKGYNIPEEKIAAVMGYKKTDAIQTLLEEFAEDKSVIKTDHINAMHDFFIKNMIEYYSTTNELEPLPYVLNTFQFLKANNVKIGLDTGFFSDITNVVIDRLGWLKNNVVDFVISSNEAKEGRPQPYMIQELMKRANVTDPKKVIKVGDTEVDVREGINANCLYSIAITTGAYTRDQLALYKPDFIIDSLQELPALL